MEWDIYNMGRSVVLAHLRQAVAPCPGGEAQDAAVRVPHQVRASALLEDVEYIYLSVYIYLSIYIYLSQYL